MLNLPNSRGSRPARLRARRRTWLGAALAVVIIGTLASTLAAHEVAKNDAANSRQAFTASSAEIASTLKLAIQHEQDLASDIGGFITAYPNASNAQFGAWTSSVAAFARYPELAGIGEITEVPASQLSSFEAQSAAGSPLQIVPAGNRPSYCLLSTWQARTGALAIPPGLDFCQLPIGPALVDIESSGQSTYIPFDVGKSGGLAVGTPVYRSGSLPTTVQARDNAFIGWVGIEVNQSVVLATALEGHAGSSVVFRYRNGASQALFRAGHTSSSPQSTTIDLHNGWHVQVLGTAISHGDFANSNALTLLISGLLLSLLLGVLVYVLGTGRSRAMLLVHERTDQLRHQALHDSLTGLPNRALILDRIDQMLARSRREHTPVAALFLDLDNFKDINDTVGHIGGDELLAGVGTRLRGALREGDTVGRLGGDEFVILTEGDSLAAGPEVVAERILDVLSAPFEIERSDVSIAVTASIGIAEGDRATPEDLLRDADIALYQAKASGKKRSVVFSASMRDAVHDHRHLEVDLEMALEAGQFFLLYQPTVNLCTGDINGVEALLRWHHPERGIVQPAGFIPTLESSGLIVPVGRWVLEEACRQGALWQQQGHQLVVSVNVSARQFERDRIIDDIYGVLSTTGFDPQLLVLELTETTLMRDVETMVTRLQLLKALGVRIAIDDFGTGYSSLAYLRQFPIDVLKIDQSFVSGITESPESEAVVHTLVQLGKLLGIETVAEGVETDDQRRWLNAEEVDIGQGFLFARPSSVDDLDRLLEGTSVLPTAVPPVHHS